MESTVDARLWACFVYVVPLLDVVDFRHPAGVLLVTADSCRWFHVQYHELNVYRKFGCRQKLSSPLPFVILGD